MHVNVRQTYPPTADTNVLVHVPHFSGNDEQVILHDVERWVERGWARGSSGPVQANAAATGCFHLQRRDSQRVPAHRRRLQFVR